MHFHYPGIHVPNRCMNKCPKAQSSGSRVGCQSGIFKCPVQKPVWQFHSFKFLAFKGCPLADFGDYRHKLHGPGREATRIIRIPPCPKEELCLAPPRRRERIRACHVPRQLPQQPVHGLGHSFGYLLEVLPARFTHCRQIVFNLLLGNSKSFLRKFKSI